MVLRPHMVRHLRQRHHESAISSENGIGTRSGTSRSLQQSRSVIVTRAIQKALPPSPSNNRAPETLGQASGLATCKSLVTLSNPIITQLFAHYTDVLAPWYDHEKPENQGDYLAATCLLRSYELLNGTRPYSPDRARPPSFTLADSRKGQRHFLGAYPFVASGSINLAGCCLLQARA
jgi:hypothetical protein